MSGSIIDYSTLSGERDLALLLVLGLLYETAVPENLQINQPSADRHTQEQEHRAQQVEPAILAEIGVSRHMIVPDKHGGPPSGGPPDKFMWGQPPSAVRRAQLGVFVPRSLLSRQHHHRLRARHHRRVRIRSRAIQTNHLPRFR